ncbi:MAG: methyltransferase domain-containing protein [Hamadaea sp.]|uniref:class I SAM-dependent methyltransferase n=1 Tax=Hamadaea sp. TaxID=2024425 RepID=UPI00182AC702|nr:class I SAM-dependent methyltransferase [Hamadaea sp.]NUR70936.1 methyltransferase domain-containing protein [Hamadaea sp.]NUT21723.1 methyltransferase domain-containing protein [Hamadaea sp.]
MITALALYSGALRRDTRLRLLDLAGRSLRHLETGAWHRLRPGDRGVLDRCAGPTLDVGCGPGRLAAALTATGITALGIDLSPTAVRLARRRGAHAVSGDVFGPVPGAGTWRHALLIDGNIGIGGDPARLLRRCAELIGPDATVLVETDPPGAACWSGPVVLHDGDRESTPFPWALVAADRLAGPAADAGFTVRETWNEEGRWFACLGR